MVDSRQVLNARAQDIANNTGNERWVNYTSLGWRIECAPLNKQYQDDGLSVCFKPLTLSVILRVDRS
jgi:hypothetical protein